MVAHGIAATESASSPWYPPWLSSLVEGSPHKTQVRPRWPTARKVSEFEARQRLQYLLAVSPTIIYTTQASGSYACTFISENLKSIMG